jgi:hypothetical protein
MGEDSLSTAVTNLVDRNQNPSTFSLLRLQRLAAANASNEAHAFKTLNYVSLPYIFHYCS